MPNARLLMGDDLHGGHGFYSTLPGIDATLADPADTKAWSFRSDWARVENLYQFGKITGLSVASNFGKSVPYADLGYIPFVTMQYIAPGTTNLQDDPWSKGSFVEVDYFTTWRIQVFRTSITIGFQVGNSQIATAPAAPSAVYYFIWKIPTWVF